MAANSRAVRRWFFGRAKSFAYQSSQRTIRSVATSCVYPWSVMSQSMIRCRMVGTPKVRADDRTRLCRWAIGGGLGRFEIRKQFPDFRLEFGLAMLECQFLFVVVFAFPDRPLADFDGHIGIRNSQYRRINDRQIFDGVKPFH